METIMFSPLALAVFETIKLLALWHECVSASGILFRQIRINCDRDFPGKANNGNEADTGETTRLGHRWNGNLGYHRHGNHGYCRHGNLGHRRHGNLRHRRHGNPLAHFVIRHRSKHRGETTVKLQRFNGRRQVVDRFRRRHREG